MTRQELRFALTSAIVDEKPVKVFIKNRPHIIGYFVELADRDSLYDKGMVRFVYNYRHEAFLLSGKQTYFTCIFAIDNITDILTIPHDM